MSTMYKVREVCTVRYKRCGACRYFIQALQGPFRIRAAAGVENLKYKTENARTYLVDTW